MISSYVLEEKKVHGIQRDWETENAERYSTFGRKEKEASFYEKHAIKICKKIRSKGTGKRFKIIGESQHEVTGTKIAISIAMHLEKKHRAFALLME